MAGVQRVALVEVDADRGEEEQARRLRFYRRLACRRISGLHLLELRQHPLRQDQHLLPRRGQAQTAPLAQPQGGAQALFQLAHTVAQGRLGDAQALGRRGQRAVLLNGLHDGQMDAL